MTNEEKHIALKEYWEGKGESYTETATPEEVAAWKEKKQKHDNNKTR